MNREKFLHGNERSSTVSGTYKALFQSWSCVVEPQFGVELHVRVVQNSTSSSQSEIILLLPIDDN